MTLRERVKRLEDRLARVEENINTLSFESHMYYQDPDPKFPYHTMNVATTTASIRDVVQGLLNHLNLTLSVTPAQHQKVLLKEEED